VVHGVTGNHTLDVPQLLRCLVFTVLSFAVVALVLLYIVPTVFLPAITGQSLPVYLLVGLVCGLPISFVITYLASHLLLPPAEQVKTPRQWVAMCVVWVSYMGSWVALAWLFETFTPFLPVLVRGIVLPLYLLLFAIIIALRTSVRDKMEHLLERIVGTSEAEPASSRSHGRAEAA
jgi:hypothetical protein